MIPTQNNDMTTNYLHEFEGAAIVPRWISAMANNHPIVVKDRDEISEKISEIFEKRNKKRFLVGYHLKGHFLFLPPAAVTV